MRIELTDLLVGVPKLSDVALDRFLYIFALDLVPDVIIVDRLLQITNAFAP